MAVTSPTAVAGAGRPLDPHSLGNRHAVHILETPGMFICPAVGYPDEEQGLRGPHFSSLVSKGKFQWKPVLQVLKHQ